MKYFNKFILYEFKMFFMKLWYKNNEISKNKINYITWILNGFQSTIYLKSKFTNWPWYTSVCKLDKKNKEYWLILIHFFQNDKILILLKAYTIRIITCIIIYK